MSRKVDSCFIVWCHDNYRSYDFMYSLASVGAVGRGLLPPYEAAICDLETSAGASPRPTALFIDFLYGGCDCKANPDEFPYFCG